MNVVCLTSALASLSVVYSLQGPFDKITHMCYGGFYKVKHTHTYISCVNLCWFSKQCKAISWLVKSRDCRLHDTTLTDQSQAMADPRCISTEVHTSQMGPSHPCTGRPCPDTQVCAPTDAASSHVCLPLEALDANTATTAASATAAMITSSAITATSVTTTALDVTTAAATTATSVTTTALDVTTAATTATSVTTTALDVTTAAATTSTSVTTTALDVTTAATTATSVTTTALDVTTAAATAATSVTTTALDVTTAATTATSVTTTALDVTTVAATTATSTTTADLDATTTTTAGPATTSPAAPAIMTVTTTSVTTTDASCEHGGYLNATCFVYKGCYLDDRNRMINDIHDKNVSMTHEWCLTLCRQGNYVLAGLEYYKHCYCGNSYDNETYPVMSEGDCDTPCAGNSSQMCGGHFRLSLFQCTSPSWEQ